MEMMKTVWKNVIALFLGVVLIALGFGGGYLYSKYQNTGVDAEIVEESTPNQIDLKLPGEVEKRMITKDEVEEKLVEIGEFATYSGEYTVSKSADQSRYFLDDIQIPGTTNSINITCNGIVKVGYDVHEITPTIDNDSNKIYIALPEPTVLDNYVIWDSIQYTESNKILNPIEFSQYQTLITEIEEEGLTKAEADGIYGAAAENVKVLIRNFLSGFDEYEVVFL